MRWIFIALILLNGLYLGWEVWRRSAPQSGVEQSRDAEPQTQGQQLVLLTERLPDARSAVPPPALAPRSVEPVTKPVIPANQIQSQVSQDKPVAAKAPNPAKDLVCYSVGPFPGRDLAAGVQQQLLGAAVGSRMQEIGPDKAARHWVILPPQPDRQKALKLLRELQTRKIDSYLVSTGELTNAISLGLFAREALATGVRDKVREAGYPAEIRQKEPAGSQFWLRLQPGQPVEKIEKLLQPTLADESGIKISNTACEMFAQAK